MSLSTHSGFIFSPISNILKEAVSASTGIGAGIETFPLCDYVMQSVFIKMAGLQEQKMKCICWDVASIDFEYRYEFTKKPLGECSSYPDKNAIYKSLINVVKKNGLSIEDVFCDRENLIESAYKEIFETFEKTNLSIWAQAAFFDFKKIRSSIKGMHIAGDEDIFNKNNLNKNNLNKNNLNKSNLNKSNLESWYIDHLYRHRNRIAHNTSSYQQNLPTLKILMDEKYKYENYFLFFFMLTLIDKIFIEVHEKFLHAINAKTD